MLSGYEIILIFVLALVFFGAKRLPELARGLGQGLREFRKSSQEITDQIENAIEAKPTDPGKQLTQSSDPVAEHNG